MNLIENDYNLALLFPHDFYRVDHQEENYYPYFGDNSTSSAE